MKIDKNHSYRWKRKPPGAPSVEIAVKAIEEIRRRRKGLTSQLLE